MVKVQTTVDLLSIKQGCFETHPQRFHLMAMLEDSVRFKNHQNKSKSIEVELESEGPIRTSQVHGDSERMQLVLLQMLQLSIDKSYAGTKVSVISRCIDSTTDVYVSIQLMWTHNEDMNDLSIDQMVDSDSEAARHEIEKLLGDYRPIC